jgi:hypothetical protein
LLAAACGWVLGFAYDELLRADDAREAKWLPPSVRKMWTELWGNVMDVKRVVESSTPPPPYNAELVRVFRRAHIVFWDKSKMGPVTLEATWEESICDLPSRLVRQNMLCYEQ